MLHQPPDMSPASLWFVRLAERTTRLSQRKLWGIVIGATIFVAILDIVTGHMSVGPVYMLIVCLAAWGLRAMLGVAAMVMIILTSVIISHFTLYGPDVAATSPWPEIWNGTARFVTHTVIALIVGGFRSTLELERWRASTDGLTGVLNKAAFSAHRKAVVDRAVRNQEAVILAYIDLDGFKTVNDHFGHSAGDRVLTRFAQGASDAIRSTDLFARIGGDEFVALLAVPDCEAGDTVAEMLHARLSCILHGTGFDVTCSMGALVVDAASIADTDDMISLADRLMYEVKQSGKNALRIARGDLAGDALRSALSPPKPVALDILLAQIDRADRAWMARVAA